LQLPTHIRGAILEEVVLYLLTLVGYRIVLPGENGTKLGHSGLEVQGRGEWHQIDALAAFDKTPAFMYPLRLMVEAKCYDYHRLVGIGVVRNSVGVQKDISENFFTHDNGTGQSSNSIQIPIYNYHTAIFSTSGYTKNAQRYALAHQIFLIQYQSVQILRPIIDAILNFTIDHFARNPENSPKRIQAIRSEIRSGLRMPLSEPEYDRSVFSEEGQAYLYERLISPLRDIKGSYFGVLQGRWPMHLVSLHELPAGPFEDVDEIRCKVYGFESDTWSFSPIGYREGEPGWFRLEFDLPEEIARLVGESRHDPVQVAHIKQEHFSYLDLSGKIGGIQRQIRFVLDTEWIRQYIDRMERRRQQGPSLPV